ncbi:hypothetical protein ACFV6F_01760 [Kitasatospora phosalacinea]|uniref:hypothetical protein n=1 Tax=Kitasatospora phosalacinea TaxID=2065 RepID=UPI00365C257C
METLACAHCGAALTGPVTRVRFPPYAHLGVGVGMLPALLDAGTYAVDPEPSGPPWRFWGELAEGEAEARGYQAPVQAVPVGPAGRLLCVPADATGTVLVRDRTDGSATMACAACRRPVGARYDEWATWQGVWLEPGAVRAAPAGPDRPPADWTELVRDRSGPRPVDARGCWSHRCEQEATMTLVDLLLAADGSPVVFEHRAAARLLGRELGHYLRTATGPAKRCALHGPGLPLADPHPDLALVPRHPQTGEAWPAPPGVRAVPLDVEVWRELAFADDRRAVRVGGPLRAELERDDPLPPHHWRPVFFCTRLVRDTLARQPGVRTSAVRAALAVRARAPW